MSQVKKLSKMLLILFLLSFSLAGCRSDGGGSKAELYSFPNQEGANSYVVSDGREAVIIDPSIPDKIISTIKEKKLKPKYIILTHGHFDHIAGIDAIKDDFPEVKVMIHSADKAMPGDPELNVSKKFGYDIAVKGEILPLTDGTRLKLGTLEFEVISTPGHTPGSICLKQGSRLFSGDTLFKGAVGRTDFPGGNANDLEASLQKLLALPDQTEVLPGHGEPTTIGDERGYLKGDR